MSDLDWADLLPDVDVDGSVDQPTSNASTQSKEVGITVAGDDRGIAGEGVNQLNTPYDLAFDSTNQYFYVVDHENARIQRFSVTGGDNRTGVTIFKLDDATAINPWNPDDKRNKPIAIFIDRNDNIFISEVSLPHRLLKISSNGTSTTVIEPSNSILRSCSGIYVDQDENIYVSDWEQYAVLKFDKNGKNGEIVAGGNGFGDASNQFDHPTGIFVAEKSGNIYVADYVNHRIQRWSPGSKEGVTVCGGNGAGKNLNQLNYPCSVIVDSDETQIYVGDSLNGRVLRWATDAKQGEIIVGGDNENDQPIEICRVGGIKFDKDNNLYVADIYGNRIRKFLINQ